MVRVARAATHNVPCGIVQLKGGDAMSGKRENQSIARVLDDAIADPVRLRELRRAISDRIGLLGLEGRVGRESARTTSVGGAQSDKYDDSLWDNMPV